MNEQENFWKDKYADSYIEKNTQFNFDLGVGLEKDASLYSKRGYKYQLYFRMWPKYWKKYMAF